MTQDLLDTRPEVRAGPSSFGDLSALYRLTDRLYRAAALEDVYEAALDAIEETLGCARASILLFDESGSMRFVAWRGLSDLYRTAVDGHTPWKPGEAGAEPILVADIDETDEPQALKEAIRAEGIRALSFVPLMVRGGVAGKFMTYHATRHVFSAREQELAILIARQVGFSLERALSERDHRRAEEALRVQEQRSRHMLETAPVMIWTSDAQGRCEHLNRMLREFWGVAEDEVPRFDWTSTIHPDDVADVGRQMAHAIASHEEARVRGRYRDRTGRYRVLLTHAQPRYASDGTFLGMIGVNADVTEREENEAALRHSEERFRLVIESAPSGMIITNEVGEIVLLNAQAERLFGYRREEVLGASIEMLVPERYRDTHAWVRQALHLEPGGMIEGADRVVPGRRKDGSEFPAEIGLSKIDSPTGLIYLACIVDISDRVRAEAQRNVLLAELNHRVKNTLAVVQGIARQTFGGASGDAAARRAFEGRLQAMAVAHTMLTRTNWDHAPLDQLAADTFGADLVARGRVQLSGPSILLDPKSSLAVAMALHELLTNAVKYGALSRDGGTVTVTWGQSADSPHRFELTWQEQGGPPVHAPQSKGFGSTLIQRILAGDLDGEVALRFDPAGVTCAIKGSRLAGGDAAGPAPTVAEH